MTPYVKATILSALTNTTGATDMPTLTTQLHALGLLCEVEVTYDMEEADKPDITEVWILGYYPEGTVDKRRDYVSINAKCALNCISDDEYKALDVECLAHAKMLCAEAWDV